MTRLAQARTANKALALGILVACGSLMWSAARAVPAAELSVPSFVGSSFAGAVRGGGR